MSDRIWIRGGGIAVFLYAGEVMGRRAFTVFVQGPRGLASTQLATQADVLRFVRDTILGELEIVLAAIDDEPDGDA